MRLGYFTMPVHPMGRTWAETLKEDREAVILADQLGFYDAFIGEHLTDSRRWGPVSSVSKRVPHRTIGHASCRRSAIRHA